MLRREADGAAWYVARRQLDGSPIVLPRLTLSWTSQHSTAAAVSDALPEIVELVESRLSALGIGVEPMEVLMDGDERRVWNRTRFDECRRLFADMNSSYLILLWIGSGADADDVDAKPDVELHIQLCRVDPTIWSASLLISRRLAPGPELNGTAEGFVQLLVDVEPVVTPVWAAVTYDAWEEARTAFEAFYGRSKPRAGQDADRHPRGYHWANLLTATHIAGLGGTARLLEAADERGLSVEVLADAPGSEKVLVRDPCAISAFDDSRLESVRDLLAPVLPDCSYTWYGGPPVRVIREPGTAFRFIPPEIKAPLFEDDPEPKHAHHLYTPVPD